MRICQWLLFWFCISPLLACETHAGVPLRPVSSTDMASIAGAGGSFTPAFSADGRFVVFVSHANNLVTNDDLAPYLDVFVRDLTTSNTVLVSVNTGGIGGGNADANYPSISANGRFVAFVSAANNLVNINDTNDAPDVFVRDLVSRVTTLVSVDVTGTSSASPYLRSSGNPLISADGGLVIFESLATNLVALADTNQKSDIFARDLRANKTYLVSVNAAGTGTGNGNSELPSIGGSGEVIAFVSTSTDLVPGATNQLGDIYVRNIKSGTTVWASRDVGAFWSNNYACFNPVLNSYESFVAFKARNPRDPSTVLLIRYDLLGGATTIVSSNSPVASLPQISADGRVLAAENLSDVYVWDLQTGSNALVSVNASGSGGGNQPSHTPVMTPDGRYILFLSSASDLLTNATNGVSQVFVRDMVNGITRLVSVNTQGLASTRNLDFTLPAISTDGKSVAFESLAADLVANDANEASDVFLRDLDSGVTGLLSSRQQSLPPATPSGLSGATANCISADGRFVVVASFDNPFAPGDTNGLPDVLERDLLNGVMTPVSLVTPDTATGSKGVLEPAVSADGRFVVFGKRLSCISCGGNEDLFLYDSQAGTNRLVAGVPVASLSPFRSFASPAVSSDGRFVAYHTPANDLTSPGGVSGLNVYVADVAAGTNLLVSVSYLGNRPGNQASFSPHFSPDDRWLVFASLATDLTTNNTGGLANLYARDLLSNTTRMLSGGTAPLGYARGAAFSADSRFVAFVTSNSLVAVYDFVNQTNQIVCPGCDNPSLSADGRLVAYELVHSGAPKEIVLKDLQTGETNLISINRGGSGGGNGDSTSPLLTWDGRFVVFASKASDLVDNDTNNASDIFVRDLMLGTTLLVSLNLQGNGAGNGPSTKPILGADGRTIVFQSLASDLVPGDYNYRRDVFVLRLDGPDPGSEPALRVLTLTGLGSTGARVVWSSTPGEKYQAQYKNKLEDAGWTNLPGLTTANGTTASTTDPGAGQGSQRFYRVMLAP